MLTPSVWLNADLTRLVSPLELIKQHNKLFYFGCELDELAYFGLLEARYIIRAKTINTYHQQFLEDEVLFARSYPKERQFDSNLPNITELTFWWLGQLIPLNGYHGQRGMRTPSSTAFNGGVLCIEFKTNEFLTIRPSYPSPSIIIEPNQS